MFFSFKSIRYTSTYEKFQYLLTKNSDTQVDKFIKRDKPLREYVKEIERLKGMASAIGSLPVLVPMHFFLLDCSKINQVKMT